jgi:hypothetical protein
MDTATDVMGDPLIRALTSVFGKLHPNPKWQWPASLPAV